MNSALNLLQPYPFQQLAKLHEGIEPPAHLSAIALSIGEPKHPAPAMALEAYYAASAGLSVYPATKGLPELRQAMSDWCQRRYQVAVNADSQILPVNGTREALFAIVQALVDNPSNGVKPPLVMMPNPFYQIYEGATLLAGAKPYYLACTADNGFVPDYEAIDDSVWQQTQVLFVCNPGNPTGAVMNTEQWQLVMKKCQQHDVILISDECYSELYRDENQPPIGALTMAKNIGNDQFKQLLVFHSLSKRSNLPGLRSGFVAGDAQIMARFLLYRTYHGCAMPLHHQHTSIAAWQDETHVVQNREWYNQKYQLAQTLLGGLCEFTIPPASFYVWLKVSAIFNHDDERFARALLAQQNVVVLPGRYLSRSVNGTHPGQGYVRMALVASMNEIEIALQRIADFLNRSV